MLLAKHCAQEQGVAQLDQNVRQLSSGAGVCEEDLPCVAIPVKKIIGHLKKGWQDAEMFFRKAHQSAYENEAPSLYGLLREAWERALEEILLGSVVDRHRPSIQTQQIGTISDISSEDCVTPYVAMSKCSKCLPGHDQAAAARVPIPEPAELKADIECLCDWVSAV